MQYSSSKLRQSIKNHQEKNVKRGLRKSRKQITERERSLLPPCVIHEDAQRLLKELAGAPAGVWTWRRSPTSRDADRTASCRGRCGEMEQRGGGVWWRRRRRRRHEHTAWERGRGRSFGLRVTAGIRWLGFWLGFCWAAS